MASTTRPSFLLLLPVLLSCSVFDTCASAAGYPASPSSQRRSLLQSSPSGPPRNIETFFPSNAAPAFSNPASTTPPPPPPPPPPPAAAPPFTAPAPTPGKSSDGTVTRAVVATAASTFVVSGLLFFAVHRFAFKQRKVEIYHRQENKFRGDGRGGVAAGNPYRPTPVNGKLKAVVVDEDGLDVLYWRKVADGSRNRCAHCMQVIRGDAEDGGVDGGRREPAAARRGRRPREDGRRIRDAPLLTADSLRSSDRIRPVLSRESDGSSASSAPSSTVAVVIASDARPVAPPPSPRLPLPPGWRGVTSQSPSPASFSPPSPPRPAAPHPSPSPPSPRRLSAASAAPPPPPEPPSAPTPHPPSQPPIAPPPPPIPHPPSAPPPPPPPPPPAAGKRGPAPPPPPPPRATPVENKRKPGPPAAPPPPVLGRPVPSPARPPAVPRSNSRPSAAEELFEEKPKEPAKLKPLHWDKVTTSNAQHSMVWDKISDGSFRFDDDLMEALFGYVATNRKSPKNGSASSSTNPFAAGAAGPTSQVCLLDPRKSQNTAIVLRSVAVTRQEILDALLEGRGLSADTLEKLSKLAPSREEEATILAFAGNPSSLADAESFLSHLLRAIPSAFARVDAMLFQANYEPEVLHLRESLQAMEAACKELRKQGLFWKMLEAVLKAGNRMNAGTARGNAQAFNLASLRKLSDVKSTDGKTTLLHFVVESVVRSEGKRCVINRNHSFGRSGSRSASSSFTATGPTTREDKRMEYMTLGLPVVGGLSIEFSNVKKAAAVDYDALVGTCSALGARVTEVQQLLAACGSGGGGFVKVMERFLERAEGELQALREEQARVMNLVKRTTEYYMVGAAQDRAALPLQLFLIVKDFLGMVDQACVDIARNLQQQKRKPPSGTASPAAPQRRVPTRFPNLPAHFMSKNSKSASSSSSGGGTNSSSDSDDDGL